MPVSADICRRGQGPLASKNDPTDSVKGPKWSVNKHLHEINLATDIFCRVSVVMQNVEINRKRKQRAARFSHYKNIVILTGLRSLYQ